MVTIAIPAYNEANYIESVIKGFLKQNHPSLLEIIVADGGSNDGTQEIVKKIAFGDSRVKLLENSLKTQSAGLNLIFKHSQGDIFLRADAHSEYAPDYIQKCIEALESSQAWNVGGSQRHMARNAFQGGVALAFRSFLAGTAKYHDPDYNGYADTVYLGCFLTDALQKIVYNSTKKELFDTTQITNQDAELNLKLLEFFEKAIYISSDIKVWYNPRSDWKKLCIQYFKYGRGRYLTTKKHPRSSPLRSKILMIFVIIYCILFLLLVYFNHTLLFLITSFSFLSLAFLIETIRVSIRYMPSFQEEIWRGGEDNIPNGLTIFMMTFVALVIMPTSYTCGNFYQKYRHLIIKNDEW
ncbi:MAG: glycosyltransferase family 2 protein [Woronichinia naegeliana WA131]|uniref:Glycosyltransferase family 2 protein n=1 Tax=Woronichinia naegeliana WA131 TaxID=2824559 RepID=A0A977KW59_9CYAN|nr:MAG: glycosyltransferase family 2 protein [Woronichinia naegeliana WA131]